MKCSECNIEMEEADTECVMTFAGDYYSPPEYEKIYIKWYCNECGEYEYEHF